MSGISKLFDQPEVIKSPQTGALYTVIAHKGASKFAINCRLEKRDKDIGLVLRMIEIKAPTGQEWPVFTSFGFRDVDRYKNSDGPDIHLFRGDKFYMPVTAYPCSPQDFTKMMDEQKVFPQVKEWLTGLVLACEGTMVISDAAFDAVLSHGFEEIPTELKKLFKLPEIVAKPFKKPPPPSEQDKDLDPHNTPDMADDYPEDGDDFNEGNV
jgi:hypothetical protein